MESVVRQVSAQALIEGLKEELKKIEAISPPPWAGLVKSGVGKERPPQQRDWWWIRCASLLRTLYVRGAGVRRLRRKYGCRARHTKRRAHHVAAGGKAIRLALQQLERAGFVAKTKSGRALTQRGYGLLESVARRLMR